MLSAVSIALLAALAAPGAQAQNQIKFWDQGENVSVTWNGLAPGQPTVPIANFVMQPGPGPANDPGEIIQFDLIAPPVGNLFPSQTAPGPLGPIPYIYTQLYEPGPTGGQIVSDEFLIYPNNLGPNPNLPGFHVVFTSADAPLIWNQVKQQYNFALVPSTLSALEIASFQVVGNIGDPGAVPDTVFSVNSVPEPGTYAMMLAGLAGLAWLGRRQRKV